MARGDDDFAPFLEVFLPIVGVLVVIPVVTCCLSLWRDPEASQVGRKVYRNLLSSFSSKESSSKSSEGKEE